MSKHSHIPCLLELFRQYGYDGATLSKISEATKLGKASLYHHFPKGKDEMVTKVLEYLSTWMQENILTALRSEGSALVKMERMCDCINEIYESGQKPCLFAILLMGSARDVFHDRVKMIFRLWIDEIAKVLHESGLDKELARERAEDAAIAIQGALIVTQATDDVRVFQRTIKQLPHQLLH